MRPEWPSKDSPAGQARASRYPTDRLPQVLSVDPEALARHRGRVLDPTTAVALPAEDRDDPNAVGRRPESSVYRADTLLIPLSSAVRPDWVEAYNKALDPLDVELRVVIPQTPAWRRALGEFRDDLQIPVLLLNRQDRATDRAPDPWAALVQLRREFGSQNDVPKIALEHLMAASGTGFESSPFHSGPFHSGPFHSGPFHSGGLDTAGVALATGSRNPVRVMGRAPLRLRLRPADLPSRRRPVVAVLDTGIGQHPWLTIADLSTKQHPDLAGFVHDPDPVVEVSSDFQQLLADYEATLATATGTTAPLLDSPAEVRDLVSPLLGLTDSHAGHGTFVTGLVHQNCPDARILSLRVVHSDGIGLEGSCLLALDWLRQRVITAQQTGNAELMVDVVSLSLGFYPEIADLATVNQLRVAIDALTDLGVVVVAAAGNHSTTRPFVPAAMGADTSGGNGGNPLLAAIGALNASGVTTAAFSNDGPWVTRWAPGNALVSTVPVWQGALSPGLALGDHGGVGPRQRTSPDEDDLTTGFAVWAGTSFATPVVAGMLAAEFAAVADTLDGKQRLARARHALGATDHVLAAAGWR